MFLTVFCAASDAEQPIQFDSVILPDALRGFNPTTECVTAGAVGSLCMPWKEVVNRPYLSSVFGGTQCEASCRRLYQNCQLDSGISILGLKVFGSKCGWVTKVGQEEEYAECMRSCAEN